jgi:hypothetical protein
MIRRARWLALGASGALFLGVATASAQGVPPEIAELRRRVAAMRRNLPDITATAELAADMFTSDTTLRFLFSQHNDPSDFIEFNIRAGGPPDTRDADDGSMRGLAIMPVRSWERGALGAAMQMESWRRLGRVVFTVGSAAGRPTLPIGDRLIDNGAPSGSAEFSDINGIANLIASWTFYAEVVGAATRRGWQPGIYLSDATPGSRGHNEMVHFRMPTGKPVPIVPKGQIGAAYLAAIDSLLDRASQPQHLAEVERAADSLRRWRKEGSRLFASSCGHFLLEELPRLTEHSPFKGIDWRWDVGAHLRDAGTKAGDGMLWFGYAGYNCPHADVADPFAAAGLRVIVVSDRLSDILPPEVRSSVTLSWPRTDAVAPIPFAPGFVAPTSSIDMGLHYLWFRRLLADTTIAAPPRGGS